MFGLSEIQVRAKLKKQVMCKRKLAYRNVAFRFLEAFQCELHLEDISRIELLKSCSRRRAER